MDAGFVFSDPKNPQFLYEKIFLGGTAIGKAESYFSVVWAKNRQNNADLCDKWEHTNLPWILASLFSILQ